MQSRFLTLARVRARSQAERCYEEMVAAQAEQARVEKEAEEEKARMEVRWIQGFWLTIVHGLLVEINSMPVPYCECARPPVRRRRRKRCARPTLWRCLPSTPRTRRR